jgi:Double zinc ribbon
MRRCTKCSMIYTDSSKICRSCGAILEDMADGPAPNVALRGDEREQLELIAQQALSTEVQGSENRLRVQYAWTCPQCREEVPGSFDVCWNCGTDRSGVEESGFAERKTETSVEAAVVETKPVIPIGAARCSACGSAKMIQGARIEAHEGSLIKIVVFADPGAALDDRVWGEVTADVCGDCGHVQLRVLNSNELYDHHPNSIGEANV